MFQLGGCVARLATALIDAQVELKKSDGRVGSPKALTLCHLHQLDACTQATNAFLIYGTGDFPFQPKEKDTWEEAAIPAVEPSVTAARAPIAGKFEEQMAHRSRVNGLKTGEIR